MDTDKKKLKYTKREFFSNIAFFLILGSSFSLINASGGFSNVLEVHSLVLSSDSHVGKIIKCDDYAYVGTGRGKAQRVGAYYYPVAKTQEGFTAIGSPIFKNKKWCPAQIGSEVTMYMPKEATKNDTGRIVTFSQFWWPVMHFLTVIWLGVSIFFLKRQYFGRVFLFYILTSQVLYRFEAFF